jgi:hypothetical protein
MDMQITTKIAPRKYFLNAPEVCRNRIIVLETPDLSGSIDYKTRTEMLLAGSQPVLTHGK